MRKACSKQTPSSFKPLPLRYALIFWSCNQSKICWEWSANSPCEQHPRYHNQSWQKTFRRTSKGTSSIPPLATKQVCKETRQKEKVGKLSAQHLGILRSNFLPQFSNQQSRYISAAPSTPYLLDNMHRQITSQSELRDITVDSSPCTSFGFMKIGLD